MALPFDQSFREYSGWGVPLLQRNSSHLAIVTNSITSLEEKFPRDCIELEEAKSRRRQQTRLLPLPGQRKQGVQSVGLDGWMDGLWCNNRRATPDIY